MYADKVLRGVCEADDLSIERRQALYALRLPPGHPLEVECDAHPTNELINADFYTHLSFRVKRPTVPVLSLHDSNLKQRPDL